MILQPIDYIVYTWFVLAACSAAYVAYDQFRNNPEAPVMKWGFVLVTLYLGPIGLLLYVMADKEPRPGEHEEFVQPLWKQAIGSTVHCVAGDATGIILAAALTALLGLPMAMDLLVEYIFGFLFGLLIFQALFMKSIMGGTYVEKRPAQLHPGAAFHELHDGRNGADDDRADDGPRHARNVAGRAALLVRDVNRRDRRLPRRISHQRVARQHRHETWTHDRSRTHGS